MTTTQLDANEYNPYYSPYISILGEVDLLDALNSSSESFQQMIIDLPVAKLHYSYEEGKWTIAQIILHLIDAERVFQYRALRFGRNDKTQIPGFEQDDYVAAGKGCERTKKELLEEFKAVRASSIALFNSFSDDILFRLGTAGGNPMSVRAIGFVLSGHVRHHMKIINERYL